MAEIIDFNSKKINQDDITKTKDFLQQIVAAEDFNMIQALTSLLQLDDENFAILALGAIQSFQQSVNNPNDKLALTQALNATGIKSEELFSSFEDINNSIEKMELSSIKKDFIKELLATILNAVNETEGIAKRFIRIPIELCHEDAKIPQYANISDSGMDVYALDDYTINPGETKLIPTGIKLAIPPGYEIQVRPKSGRALKTKIRIPNTPGTIKVA